jgi:hypothetical protein
MNLNQHGALVLLTFRITSCVLPFYGEALRERSGPRQLLSTIFSLEARHDVI